MMDSPAWETGLQNGDVIVGMDGEEITSVEAYQSKLLSLEPGSTIEVAVKRQGMNDYLGVTCNVTVGKLQ